MTTEYNEPNPGKCSTNMLKWSFEGTSNIPAHLYHALAVHPGQPQRPSTDGTKEMWLFWSGGSGEWGKGGRVGEVQSITYRMKRDHLGFLSSSFWLRKAMTSPRRRRDLLLKGAWPGDEERNWCVPIKGTSRPRRKERKLRGDKFVTEWVLFVLILFSMFIDLLEYIFWFWFWEYILVL